MPFGTPKLHAGSCVEGADEEEEGDANGDHGDGEIFKLYLAWHV